MVLSSRSRSGLVVAPILTALVLVAAIGGSPPSWIDPRILKGAVVAVTAVAVALTGRAALRTEGAVRAVWAAGAAVAGLGALSVLGNLSGAPGWLVWGLPRVLIVAALAATALTLHRLVRRTWREWCLLLLDGWLVTTSAFMVLWVLFALGGSEPDVSGGVHPALAWVPVDLLVATVVVGRALRTRRDVRVPALLMTLAALLGLTADVTWGLTGTPSSGALWWLVQTAALAGCAALGPADLWRRRTEVDDEPPLTRVPQAAVVPGLIAAVVPAGDLVVVTAAISVVLALAVELTVSSRQNHRLWQTLHSQAQRLDLLLRESRDALVQIDGRGLVRFANDALSELLGYTPDDVLGRLALNLVHPDDRERLVAEVTRLGESDAGGRVSGRFQHADGTWRTFEATVSRRSGGEAGYTLSARDVSERVILEDELRRLAGTDALTSLLNRPAFLTVLESRLRQGPAAVLFVDLDGFKAVNDMDGHAAGDRLLRQVSETLRRELRGLDVAARLGGDEFAILIGTDQLSEVRAVAERLVQRLRRMPSDPAHRTAASIGVAVGTRVSAETLLGDADLAMYEAKGRGGRRHVVFEPWMRERITEKARMGAALEQACAGEGLLLDVQPIVDMTSGTWVGFEALARWQDGQHRREPHEFLPVAEESGLIDPIGRWVLHRALTWLVHWPDQAAGVSVNVAGSQLATPGFGDWVHQQLAGLGVAPGRLTLEISERTELGNLQRATAVLQPLRALGVRIALDDFGTGFSSLGHLAELPVDELKIDRRFVIGLGRRVQDDALVRAVCQLASDMGLRVVAEGVETPAQEAGLLDHGCHLGQGYRFQRPTPIGVLTAPASSSPQRDASTANPGESHRPARLG
ncbi:MAG: hypothetical protein QG622_3739 [Actinomycetota bacterium]|nr:hypothetical protein [Actinomycetota bacterium]